MEKKEKLDEIIEKVKKAADNEIIIQEYWKLGKLIYNNSENMREIYDYCELKIKDMSVEKLNKIKKFYETYKNFPIKRLNKLNWSSHEIILSKTQTIEEKEFYIKLATKENYSVKELKRQINSKYYERYIQSKKMLQEKQIKDTRILENYSLEFLELNDMYSEKELRKAIVSNLKDFMLELGRDFTFLGEEYKIPVGNEYFYIDLLFYNRSIMSLVAIELKIGEFRPEYISKMNFYLKVLDEKVRKTHENSSIGLILCKNKNNDILSYATNGNTSTIIVSEYNINSNEKVSRPIHETLESLLKGNGTLILTDDQKIVYENAKLFAKRTMRDNEKSVLIVKGDSGSGKTSVALQLLCEFVEKRMICEYVTQNNHSRQIYYKKLEGILDKTHFDKLFTSAGRFCDSKENEFDILIVDEAHKLREKSGIFQNRGENQIKEIINASKFSIFFIDEKQRTNIYDIGSVNEIEKQANLLGAKCNTLELNTQFRYYNSEEYIDWLDSVLEIRQSIKSKFKFDYDIKIIDNPNELKNIIAEKNLKNNKSRILAGYCWDWKSEGKNRSDIYDIEIPEYNFRMSWNLSNTSTWAIDSNSVNEVGSIYTAQGIEFDYVGVIIGKDLRYENGKIITDFRERASTDKSMIGIKRMYSTEPEKALKIADQIIKNTYKILLTRGKKGCYIFCEDKGLAKYMREVMNFFND